MSAAPARVAEASAVADRLTAWAAGRRDVVALGLAGSWAAARARDDSDIDLIVLTPGRRDLAGDLRWLPEALGPDVRVARVQDWGPHLTEVRAELPGGFEVELGLADPAWAGVAPVDPGTARVVTDGWVTLHDPQGVLAALTTTLDQRPPADFDITEDLVRDLLAAQHPDLAALPLHHEAGGWDNEMWRLGDGLAVRLPRRGIAAALLANEDRWLPVLAPLVPVPVPTPVRLGHPGAGYPYPWSVVPWLAGAPAWRTDPADRAAWAVDLADALAALHVPADPAAPVNPFRAVPLAERDEAVRQRLVPPLAGSRAATEQLAVLWADALAAEPWSGPPLWVHGDAHPANLLVDADDPGRLAGLLDFGDLSAGDPACDLATAWLTFDADARAAFRGRLAERGLLSDDLWRRARGWAVAMGLAMARRPSNVAIGSIGRHAVDQLLAEPLP